MLMMHVNVMKIKSYCKVLPKYLGPIHFISH